MYVCSKLNKSKLIKCTIFIIIFTNQVFSLLLCYIAITLVARMRVKRDDDLSKYSHIHCEYLRKYTWLQTRQNKTSNSLHTAARKQSNSRVKIQTLAVRTPSRCFQTLKILLWVGSRSHSRLSQILFYIVFLIPSELPARSWIVLN